MFRSTRAKVSCAHARPAKTHCSRATMLKDACALAGTVARLVMSPRAPRSSARARITASSSWGKKAGLSVTIYRSKIPFRSKARAAARHCRSNGDVHSRLQRTTGVKRRRLVGRRQVEHGLQAGASALDHAVGDLNLKTHFQQ